MAPAEAMPLSADEIPDVAIVGAGVQGMGTARRLADEGLKVVVIERQGDLGGVWSSWANASSRVQVSSNYYRLGYDMAEEDYTTRGNVLSEMRSAAASAGVLERLRLSTEVVRVRDEPGEDFVRLSCRPTNQGDELGAPRPDEVLSAEAPLEELRAREVIFCTGGLQRPRQVSFQGEEAFGGPVIYGLGSRADALDLRGKRVVVIGMGAFGIENARSALFAGAAHVDIIAKRRNVIITRFAAVLGTTADNDVKRAKDNQLSQAAILKQRQAGEAKSKSKESSKKGGFKPQKMMETLLTLPFTASGAGEAMPQQWLGAMEKGRPVGGADSPNTVPTCSDVFFIGYALGRVKVHTGRVDHLEPGTVVLDGGTRLQADVFIKNLGFEEPEANNRLGSLCEIVGHAQLRAPIWITPRVMTFRSEPAQLRREDMKHMGEVYALPASVPFFNDMWTEVYLHFRRRPEELRQLLDSPGLPTVPLSQASILQVSRGLFAVLSSSDELREKIVAHRRRMNADAFRRYSPPKTPKAFQRVAWIAGFLKQNKLDWEEDCRKLTGDPKAVPFIWEAVAGMFMGGSQRPVGQAAL